MKSIRQREIELFEESYRLRDACFEINKENKMNNKNFKRCREIQKKQDEVYKKQQFFKNYLKEMGKLNDREN